MNSQTRLLGKSLAVRGAVAAAAIVACASASAVTLDPTKIPGVTAPLVSFDSLQVYEYAVATVAGSGFTETGLLNISVLENDSDGSLFFPKGDGGFGLYASFTATGTVTGANGGMLDTLVYDLYGYKGGGATFKIAGGVATTNATGSVMLATGSLVPNVNNNFGTKFDSGTLQYTYLNVAAASFVDLTDAFSPVAGLTTSFINGVDSLKGSFSPTGFTVTAASGSIQLIPSAVPEPETYALMLGGLAAVGFVARRRSTS